MTIYYIRNGEKGPVKIGFTASSAHKRMKQLQTGQPEKLIMLGTSPGEMIDEQSIHRELKDYCLNGEWFDAKPELMSVIKKVIDKQLSWFHFRILRAKSLIKDREELKELFSSLSKEALERLAELDAKYEEFRRERIGHIQSNSDGTPKMIPANVLIREVTPLRKKLRESEATIDELREEIRNLKQQVADKELQPVGTGVRATLRGIARPAASLCEIKQFSLDL